MATLYNIETFKGETLNMAVDLSIETTPENPMPEPVSVENDTFFFTVKKLNDNLPHNRNAILKVRFDKTTYPNNIAQTQPNQVVLYVPSEDMNIQAGTYKYDLRKKTENGDIDTICYGKLIVNPSITEVI
jgi:hypothetical protein